MAWKRLMKFYEIEDAHFHDLRHESISKFFSAKNLSVPEVTNEQVLMLTKRPYSYGM